MVYLTYTQENSEVLARSNWLKTAGDLAGILDNQLFEVKLTEKDNYSVRGLAEARERAFNDFCAICALNDLPLPELEPELYEVYLPKEEYKEEDVARTQKRKQHILSQLRGNRSAKARDCRALVKTLEMFPDGGGWSGISINSILAVVNANLVSLGCEPVRPNYTDRKLDFPKDKSGPSKTAIALIVDDDKKEIIKTARAIAGWPGLQTEYLYYNSSNGWGADKEKEIEKTAQAVIERNVQIVLMDQGMPPMDGSEVILKIKESAGINSPIFVANTSGDADEIHKAGALKNCNKGENLEGIQKAIRMLE